MLEQAGVTLRYRCFPGLVHGFASMSGAVAAAREAVAFAAATLSRELGGQIAALLRPCGGTRRRLEGVSRRGGGQSGDESEKRETAEHP